MHLPPQTASAEAAQQPWSCSTESSKKENSDTNNNIVVGGRDEFEEDEGVIVGSLKPVTTNILVRYGPCLMGIIVIS